MIIPDKIKILGKQITVRKAPPSEIEDVGDWDGAWHLIRIRHNNDPAYPEDKVSEAFLHEIIEALNDLLELKLKHRVRTALSEGLFQVIRDNKLDFVKEEEKKEKCGSAERSEIKDSHSGKTLAKYGVFGAKLY